MRRVLVPVLATVLTALLAGCTIVRVPGPRALTRAEIHPRMPNLPAELAQNWREDILDDPEVEKFIHRQDTYGYSIYGRYGPVMPLLVGNFKLERHLKPGWGSSRREIIEQKDWSGILSPLLYSDYRTAHFDVESGRSITVSELTAITPLLAWGTTIGPPGRWNEVPPAVSNGAIRVSGIEYEEESGLYLLGGALAFGTHNRAPFLQILWIQFPLGSGLD